MVSIKIDGERAMRRQIMQTGALLVVAVGVLLGTGRAAQAQVFEARPPAGLLARGGALGDYDHDGWPDKYGSEYEDWSGNIRLFMIHNEGGACFADRSDRLRVQRPAQFMGGGSIFGDYDNDGDLDLFVPVGGWEWKQHGPDLLLRNDRL